MRVIASIPFRRPLRERGFSLLEVIVVMGLLSFIILGLMMMFSQVQQAYKLGTTQVDVLESGRAVDGMLTRELAQITPSRGSNCVNFYALLESKPPLLQQLSGAVPSRTNVLSRLYFLTYENQRWTGIGYFVHDPNDTGMGTLYRYETNAFFGQDPAVLYASFLNAPLSRMSRLVDGVLHFKARIYNTNGVWVSQSDFKGGIPIWPRNSIVDRPVAGPLFGVDDAELCRMTNNAVPAAVEVELGILEDTALARAKTYIVANPPNVAMLANQHAYLTNQASRVHVFRTRVPVRNVDPTAFQ